MNPADMTSRLNTLIYGSKVGLLTTIDNNGFPQTRWMTPAILEKRPGFIYAVAAPDSSKVLQIRKHPQVEWTFQTMVLNEVLSVKGYALLLDDSGILDNVMAEIGLNLQIFWQNQKNRNKIVIIETEIKSMSSYYPLRNEQYNVSF